MENEFLVITSKEYTCPHCKKDIQNIQRALWILRICEHLQLHNSIKIRVTKRNMPYAELPISILKDAFMLEEERRIEITDTSKKTGKQIRAIEISLYKIPAIRR